MFKEKAKILIIDDRPENLHALKITLQALEDVEIFTAQSGDEGLSKMIEQEFAVVLLDVQMPEMDGFETASLMQGHNATRNVPIIFVTAISKDDVHVFKGYESGAVDYLFKPLNHDILLSKVRVFIKLYKQRKECEQLQREIQKIKNIESLGVFAAGIAHDFNNLLTAFFSNLELAKLKCPGESPVRENLDAALNAIHGAKDLTRQLVTFAQGGAPVKEGADIIGLLNDATTSVMSGTNINVRFDITKPVDRVDVDKGQIDQVFQNLLLNAKEAMPDGGSLSIRVEHIEIENDNQQPLINTGKYVKITFTDTGPGVSDDVMAQIFDPYFSTKQFGDERGHGLGLTISLSIIKRHGGYLQAVSKPGKGAAFSVYLPASRLEQAAVPEKQAPTITRSPRTRESAGKKILLLEDEAAVAKAVAQMLGHMGYEVGVADNGSDAIKFFTQAREEKKPFDIAIFDLTLREGEKGEEVLAKFLEIDPTFKAIVATGYSEHPILSNFTKYGFSAAISKPYYLKDIKAAINKLDLA
ncbi:response regulator [Thermodesulfobacteriota bacterium]